MTACNELTPAAIAKLLSAGGTGLGDLSVRRSGIAGYSCLDDPAGAETLGAALAAAAGDSHPTRVLIWEDCPTVLGHIVARELGATLVRGLDASGVLDHEGALASRDRVLLVADSFRSGFALNALLALVGQHRAILVGAAAFVSTPELDDHVAQGQQMVLLTPRAHYTGESP